MSNRSENIWTYRHSRQKAFIKAAGSLFKLIFPCKCFGNCKQSNKFSFGNDH